jgi:hypothetical protein
MSGLRRWLAWLVLLAGPAAAVLAARWYLELDD